MLLIQPHLYMARPRVSSQSAYTILRVAVLVALILVTVVIVEVSVLVVVAVLVPTLLIKAI